MLDDLGPEGGEPGEELAQPALLLLVRDTEVTDADRRRIRHRAMRPDARVLTREHLHGDVRREPNRLAAGDRHQLRVGNSLRLHDAYALVGADDRRPRPPGDPFGAEEVVEMGMADDDPIRAVDLVDR